MTLTLRSLDKSIAADPHIAPFRASRDLGELATLIEVAFGQELDASGSNIVRDMRQMALWGPLAGLAQFGAPLFAGYVWLENGRLVGNVSLTQEQNDPRTWVISNVAVFPEYRGRGIAGQLLDTTIAYVRSAQGQRILLQVRSDNPPALTLYRQRGFVTYDVIHELGLPPQDWPVAIGDYPTSLRHVRARDAHSLYAVVMASVPHATLIRRPIYAEQFRRGLTWQIGQYWQIAMGGPQRYELVGEASGEIVAYGGVTARLLSGPYTLDIYVLPERRGTWELSLASQLIEMVAELPHHRLQAHLSASHPEAIDALRKLGFQTQRVLDQMSLDLV